jgi:hypothetical protein
VGTVDNPAVVCGIGVGLCTKLETKVLDNVYDVFSKPVTKIVVTEWYLQDGGRLKDCATLLRLTMTVLMPFPFPSILDKRRSIL